MKIMNEMKGIKLLFCVLLCCFQSCEHDIPMVSLGIDDVYAVERMKKVCLHPEFPGDAYLWSMPDASGNDSILSQERDYIFLAAYPGAYNLKLRIVDKANPVEHNIRIVVWEEQVEYSRYISRVYDYVPAPGQFINKMPQYSEGDTEEDMRKKAEESIAGTNNVMISLGGYGGYVTFGFDHTVVNLPGEYDFRLYGNAFYADTNLNPGASPQGGSSEPGIVMVSLDKNNNGLPDDEWYELAGSEHYKETTIKDYQIIYYRPDPDKPSTPDTENTYITDLNYIYWEDNLHQSGYMPKLSYHAQDYFPKWITANQLTYSGTRLADNAIDESGAGLYWVQYAFEWGYADNLPNAEAEKNSFDIAWAVDKDGKPVHLPGVDFIRVYTGLNQHCGWIGETSTEISKAEDLHIQ